ncbi:MAG: DUF3325 family protein [Pseudomonadota bacterium]
MELLTVTALLYVASALFFHAAPKRTAFARVKTESLWRRGFTATAWALVAVALVLMVSLRGLEVGIPLWLGAWVLAAIASLFLEALWKRAHVPSMGVFLALFFVGLSLGPWGEMI